MQALRNNLRIFSTYLRVTGASRWENDFAKFRKDSYFMYTKAQSIVFIFLGFIALSLPFIVAICFHDGSKFGPTHEICLIIFTFLIYEILVVGMGFFNWGDKESEILDKWRSLN